MPALPTNVTEPAQLPCDGAEPERLRHVVVALPFGAEHQLFAPLGVCPCVCVCVYVHAYVCVSECVCLGLFGKPCVPWHYSVESGKLK